MEHSDNTKQTVRVTIFNQNYTLSTSGDARATEEIAHQIDELMSSIARRAGNLDSTRTAVLACLHLADRLRSVELELSAVQNRTQRFATLLDGVLEGE